MKLLRPYNLILNLSLISINHPGPNSTWSSYNLPKVIGISPSFTHNKKDKRVTTVHDNTSLKTLQKGGNLTDGTYTIYIKLQFKANDKENMSKTVRLFF